MDPVSQFKKEREDTIEAFSRDLGFQERSRAWVQESMAKRYVYNFDWMGRPIIQYPQDVFAMQELIWSTRPDVIIETGIAHGGSLVLSASLLAMLDWCDAAEAGAPLDTSASARRVIGVDIDIPVFAVSLGGMHRALTVSGGPSSTLHRPVPRSAATAIAKPIAALVLDLEGRPMRPTKAELFGMTTVGRGFNGDLVLVSGVAFSGTLWAKGPTQGQVENAAREAFGLAGGTGLPLIAPYVSQRSALGGADMTEARNLLASVAIVSLLFGATLIVGGISGRGPRHLATRERKPSQTASGSSTRYFDPLLPQDEIQQSEDHQRMSSQLDFRALSRLRSRL